MKLHELRLKSDAFIANIDSKIVESIMSVENDLVDLNREQMMSNIDSEAKSLIHASTGSALLSPPYAKRHNKSKPDLFLSGEFQKAMFLEVNENDKTWFIDSMDSKSGILTTNYGLNIFGIMPANQFLAKRATLKSFTELYKSEVLNG